MIEVRKEGESEVEGTGAEYSMPLVERGSPGPGSPSPRHEHMTITAFAGLHVMF